MVRTGHGDSRPPRRPSSPTETPNVFVGVALSLGRKLLFIDTAKFAVALFIEVCVLSIISSCLSFPEEIYIVQKHSVFNQYGVKLGWFWTCVAAGPFIWFASKAANRDKDRWIIDILRLVVGTILWYSCVGLFHRLLVMTSRCDIDVKLSRTKCSEKNGHWIPGIDISGHCFLMIYSLLIMSEEAKAFRGWYQLSQSTPDESRTEFAQTTKLVQYFFIAMLVLSGLWLKQLVISLLYYHIWYDKVVGALVAILCWAVTYRMLYPIGFLQPPTDRLKSPQSPKRR